MKHLSEEEQLDIYYEEGSQEAKAHLKACRECSTRVRTIQADPGFHQDRGGSTKRT